MHTWNRRAILELLSREAQRAAREGKPLGLIMVDLDHFKVLNDTHGHPVGDEALRETAQLVRSSLRAYDFLGRYGGEEFLIVLPNTDRETALRIAQRIKDLFATTPVETSVGKVRIAFSMGVGSFQPRKDDDPLDLIVPVDQALYRAKNNGRDRIEAVES